jgi:hypothetical protein
MQRAVLSNGMESYKGLVNLPGYQLYEYQLVLAIPEALKEKLRKVKQQFHEQFNLPLSGNTAILLPLVKFKQRQLLEEKMRQSLQQLILGWRPFSVNLKDYGSQPSHSIFIPLTSKTLLHECSRDLKSIQQLLRTDKEHAPYFIGEHQFTIASRLAPGIFEKAWQQYSGRHFTGQFLAEACLLLKRKTGEQYWQITQRFELRNLPVGVKQTSLFD